MRRRLFYGFCFLGMLFFISPLMAATTLGGAAQNLLTPTEILTKLVIFACYVGGVGICLTALVQYNIHRKNPKLVPLTTPVMLLIVGIILIFLPYFSTVFSDTFVDRPATEKSSYGSSTRTFELPTTKGDRTKQRTPSVPKTEEKPIAPPLPPKGSHWSDDPRYQ
ncbi:MAG TPA: hypothetical protein VJ205_00120 [Gammaproteobacteria bacterium]|nr:hypothetical protein [Gammaproteobacteria bacterium]